MRLPDRIDSLERFLLSPAPIENQDGMKTVEVLGTDGALLCRAQVADNIWTRGWGLLGRKALAPGTGLLIERTSSVHTMFMRFTIDVAYLDASNVVVKTGTMRPFRFSFGGRGAKKVLELESGALARNGIARGNALHLTTSVDQPGR